MKKGGIGLLVALGGIAVAAAVFARPFSKKSIQSYVLRNQKVIIHNIPNELRHTGIGTKQNFRSRRI